MQRRVDGWHLELVAFGGDARADELVASVGGMDEGAAKREGGRGRREFRLTLDAKGAHELVPIHISIFAYGPAADAPESVPDLSHADGVLFVDSGDATLDARVLANVDAALAKRLGNPPRIVQHTKGEPAKVHLRTLVKSTVQALKKGELHEFWVQSARSAEAVHDAEVFGALTKEAIVGRPKGDVVVFLLRVIRDRGRRAVQSGRLANSEAYERCLSKEWRRLLVVNALEMLVGDDGVAALFGAPNERAMDREEVTVALAGLKRIGATKKAEIIERALLVAREGKLWEAKPDAVATGVLEELSSRFYAIDDEPLHTLLEEYILKSPEDFTLGAYED